jgi:hypothetical protein
MGKLPENQEESRGYLSEQIKNDSLFRLQN